MKEIWKHPLGGGLIDMPEGAVVLSVQEHVGVLTLWAIVDPEAKWVTRKFCIIGTGYGVSDDFKGKYIGTVQQMGGQFVWHVFEV